MRVHFFPTQDTTVYQSIPIKDHGRDEILEVGKDQFKKNIRSLIQFDISSISSSIASSEIPSNAEFYLSLFVANSSNITPNQKIDVCIASRSWFEGAGYFYQDPVFETFIGGGVIPTGSNGPSFFPPSFFSEAFFNAYFDVVAGSSTSAPSASYVITRNIEDPLINITELIKYHISESVENNGYIIKFDNTSENDINNIGNIKFFSLDTHTVHVPSVVAVYNDQRYVTSSLPLLQSYDCKITPINLKRSYKRSEMVRINLSVRDAYPLKTFDTIFSSYSGKNRLPQTSYFSIVDQQSNVVIFPFDDSTRIDCDEQYSFIRFNTNMMYRNRFYKIMFKVVDDNGVRIYDDGFIFTIGDE